MRIDTLIVALSSFFCLAASAQTLILTTEDYPPFNFVDPKSAAISGIATEKVVELMRRTGEKYTMNVYPWARAFQMGRFEADTCVFSTARTAERETMFKWVGPVATSNWYIFARADDKRNPKTLEDLRPYVVGSYRNAAIAEVLNQKGYKTDLANNDMDNPRKLLYGRFDFWATGELLGIAILKSQGLMDKIVPLFQFQQSEMYLACNVGIAQRRIDNLNQALKDMEHDGTTAAIEKKYR